MPEAPSPEPEATPAVPGAKPQSAEIQRVCRLLEVEFDNPELIQQALRHKSVGTHNNERLEFLGDAVLGQVIAHALYLRYPKEHEDGLSLMRAALVRRDSLAEIARELDLGRAIELGAGELKGGGHRRNSILADAFEAIIGAVTLDGGFGVAEALLLRLFEQRLETVSVTKDSKTKLQELLQAKKDPLPIYEVVEVTGPDHARRFEVCCELTDGTLKALGEGSSRREAEQKAAGCLLELIEARS